MSARDSEMQGSAKRGSGEAVRRERELVQLRTGDAAFDDAWRWAIHNVNSVGTTTAPVPDRIARGLDALAMGDFATARAILVSLRDQDASGGYADPWLWLVSGYFAATGDIGWARREWTRVREALAPNRPSTLLLRALATTAESIGEVAHHKELLAATSLDPAVPDPIRHHDSQRDAASVLRIIASGGDPTWPPGSITSLMAGLIGFEPDAARNRVRLRPVVPDDWDRLAADNLRTGDGTLGLRYERAATEHRFGVLPQRGGVPFRVVFEPAVAGDRVRSITIDGKTAQLDLRRIDNRWVCPVQFELDQERVVLVVTESSTQ